MKTISYKNWQIELYQWFAKRRYEITCCSPSGSIVNLSQISMRCWFKEEFAIDEAKEFIDSIILSEQNFSLVPLMELEYTELAKNK
jgi:hypothetical protein